MNEFGEKSTGILCLMNGSERDGKQCYVQTGSKRMLI